MSFPEFNFWWNREGEYEFNSSPKYRSLSTSKGSPFPADMSGLRTTTGQGVAEYGDRQVRSVSHLPSSSPLRSSQDFRVQPHQDPLYLQQNVRSMRAPSMLGSNSVGPYPPGNVTAKIFEEGEPSSIGKSEGNTSMYSGGDGKAPEIPPFFHPLRTHFETQAGAEVALDALIRIFRTNSIVVEIERPFRLLCSAHVRHRLVKFSVRLFQGRGGGEEGGTTLIEFQRVEGCGLIFSSVFRHSRITFESWEKGTSPQPGVLASVLKASGALPMPSFTATDGEEDTLDEKTASVLMDLVTDTSCPSRRREGAQLFAMALNEAVTTRCSALSHPGVERALRTLLRSEDEAVRLSGMSVFATLCGRYSELDEEQQAWLRDRVGQLIMGLKSDQSPHVQREAARALAGLSRPLAEHIRVLGGVDILMPHCRAQDAALSGFAMTAFNNTRAC